jgi:hypothetical protein
VNNLRYSALIFILLLVQVVLHPVLGVEDWIPQEPTGERELTILKPLANSVIPGNARDFVLLISGKLPKPEWIVQLEWARIEPARDPSIETVGRWSMNTPPNARATILWPSESGPQNTQNTSISMTGFRPGYYAVRAKLWTRPDNTWTDWRKFAIGNTTFDPNRLGQAAGIGTPSPGKQMIRSKTPTSGGNSTQNKSIGSRIGVDSKGIIVVGGKPAMGKIPDTNTRSGAAIEDKPGSVLPVPPSKRILKTAAMHLRKPSLWINISKGLAMTSLPQLNKPFGVSVPLINLGSAANGNTLSNKITVKATCVALSGGACKINLSLPVPVIQPGQSKSWGNLHGMFTASKPGKYRVSVSITPANKPKKGVGAGYTQTWSKDFTIKSVTIKPGMPKPSTTTKQIKSPILKK